MNQKSNVTVPLRFTLTTPNGKIANIVYSVQGHNECAIQSVAKIWADYVLDNCEDKLFKIANNETFIDAISKVHKIDISMRVSDTNWSVIAGYLSIATCYCSDVYPTFNAHVNIYLSNTAIKSAYGI